MSKKYAVLAIALVAVLALAAVGTSFAFAQAAAFAATPVPATGYGPGRMMGGQTGYSTGRMGGRGGMMGGYAQSANSWEGMDAMHQWMVADGGMHTFVWETLAEKLGLTSDALTAEVNSGKTIAQIAEAKDVSRADLVAVLETAHQDSLAQAVKAGTLTQAQADSLKTQMAGRYEWMLDNMGQGGMMGGQYGGGRMMHGQAGAGGCGGQWSGASATPQPKP